MQQNITEIQKQFELDLETATSEAKINEVYLKYLSKSAGLTTMLVKKIPSLSSEEKKLYGPKINTLIEEQKNKINDKKNLLAEESLNDPLLDLTLPEKATNAGFLHPTTQVIRQLNEFFRYSGFSVAEGPEIETALFNFRKLNLPEGHPATDLQDTLFIQQLGDEMDIVLRTHTSSVEARILTNYEPPIRVVVPGKCFRNETLSSTNGAYFNQYQGFVVDKGITIQHLMSTLEQAHKYLYGEDTKVRFRYKYYPEVSPGVGVDMQCKFCGGEGCDVCKYRGWIEALGSGMIHYNTLKMCGIDPEIYTGFAFGMGLDRLVMQKFGVSDLRTLYGGKLAYL
ncbi:phenylalanine--tRNA ligase subunit alpha [Candidatus Nomurabacteria bacterium]|uniref:phenylalanine--tRNA ligase n=1 Tax=candidate division WWE3 bacterium TaxID=2053526 RepID=A0A955E180_UNCKA|nr:phenylalanine--tRNA ligase subunit alpha [candidate division WWE3 bacterium]MCB9823744.1 phenylalanine--tRNA ligase subunit alpha [Candidatus Nomurabacteria bacterium]MCB9827177.1 phenylalanine--tRNA ligase subunit alpha [Candidatus Nomurabacteria bacterium]MCB9827539.1 phenylalanine--tRNA ligase subunit alpha [Candidatus Nomurabacteria bacterium]HXK52578.1 phenylalanine--tRNA ligase subunit alpha [bacterium]